MPPIVKINDVVLYAEKEGDLWMSALVMGTRDLVDHRGEDDEPLLSLVFVREILDPISQLPKDVHGTGVQGDMLQVRNDVAHISHRWNEDQQLKYGKKLFEGGRWQLPSDGYDSDYAAEDKPPSSLVIADDVANTRVDDQAEDQQAETEKL